MSDQGIEHRVYRIEGDRPPEVWEAAATQLAALGIAMTLWEVSPKQLKFGWPELGSYAEECGYNQVDARAGWVRLAELYDRKLHPEVEMHWHMNGLSLKDYPIIFHDRVGPTSDNPAIKKGPIWRSTLTDLDVNSVASLVERVETTAKTRGISLFEAVAAHVGPLDVRSFKVLRAFVSDKLAKQAASL